MMTKALIFLIRFKLVCNSVMKKSRRFNHMLKALLLQTSFSSKLKISIVRDC